MAVTYPNSSSRFFTFDQRIKDQDPDEIKNDEINSKKFCVLKKNLNNGKIFHEFIPLNYQFDHLIEDLKVICQNPNRQVEDMEQFINEGPLNELLKTYWGFCRYLSGTYEGLRSWDNDYENNKFRKEQIDSLKLQIDSLRININKEADKERLNSLNNKLEKLENELKILTNNLKDTLLTRIKWGRIAFMLEVEYDKCSSDQEILAYSNRRVGYYSPSFTLGDVIITFSTNFGYGSASYFYLKLKYKNIEILPYSDWVNYSHVQSYDIKRYTRKYELQNFSWYIAFTFTAEIYNYSISDPASFVKIWIVNECEEMVSRLELLLKNFDQLLVYNHWFYRVEMKISGYHLLDFKGEKISGALTFIDNISDLKEISVNAYAFINRIMKCNKNIYNQLTAEVNVLQKQIELKQDEINRQTPIVEKLKIKNDKYDEEFHTIKNEIDEKEAEDSKFSSDKLALNKIKEKYDPDYSNTKKELEEETGKLSSMNSKLLELQGWKRKFDVHIEVIRKHFEENNESLIA